LFLVLGQFIYAPFQPLKPIRRHGLIRLSRNDRC
jgi:hypothetical protein